MAIVRQTGDLSEEDFEGAAVVPAVPSALEELERMLVVVRERLFHPQAPTQVFADTLLLSAITREIAIQEEALLLVHAQRRLAVFELGLQAILACPGFEWKKDANKLEELNSERAGWDDRVWEAERLAHETISQPIGFFQPEAVRQPTPSTFPSLRKK